MSWFARKNVLLLLVIGIKCVTSVLLHLPFLPSHNIHFPGSSHFSLLNGSDLCSLLFAFLPGTSATATLTFALLIVCMNLLLNSPLGVAGTNTTVSFFPSAPLNHSPFLVLLSFALSTFLHSLGLYNGSSPC